MDSGIDKVLGIMIIVIGIIIFFYAILSEVGVDMVNNGILTMIMGHLIFFE